MESQTPPVDCFPPLRPAPDGHWNLGLDLAELEKPLDFDRLFGRSAPVEIEVGIGSGFFCAEYAKDHPEINLLGIDKTGSETHRTNDKCRRRGLTNVRVLRCDALYFLEDYPPEHSVDTYHVYYSDPWPKKRHHRRRLWQPRFIEILRRTLKPGGRLFMKTDVTEYFEVIDGLLHGADFLELVHERRLDLDPMGGDYETNFQNKAIEQGHPLHYQEWRRGQ
ncbi:tRNA (guanosine(46)-N7)-methyltransferase TrmB [bacterium]|nr:tRNA (guanosine(46)-N7)-methyltransferase TrmB [bacterium]